MIFKRLLIAIFLCAASFSMFAQDNPAAVVSVARDTVKLTLPTLQASKGRVAKVPISVEGFKSIGSMSLRIGFNPKVLKFTGITGQPKTNFLFTDAKTANVSGELAIAWFDLTPLNVGAGTFCTLKFAYKGGACAIVFKNKHVKSTITDAMGNNLVAELVDGSVGSGK